MKGGIRGASIYTLTNFTATPAAVASAMITVAFGIAEQAYQLKMGNVDEQRFIENSEMLLWNYRWMKRKIYWQVPVLHCPEVQKQILSWHISYRTRFMICLKLMIY